MSTRQKSVVLLEVNPKLKHRQCSIQSRDEVNYTLERLDENGGKLSEVRASSRKVTREKTCIIKRPIPKLIQEYSGQFMGYGCPMGYAQRLAFSMSADLHNIHCHFECNSGFVYRSSAKSLQCTSAKTRDTDLARIRE